METEKLKTSIDAKPAKLDKWLSKLTPVHTKTSRLRKEDLEEFVQFFFRRANDRYLRRIVEITELDTVAEFSKFTSTRKAGEIKVKIHDAKNIQDGLDEGVFALETCMADQRFIIDTLKLCFAELGLKEEGSVHFSFPIRRDEAGNIVSISKKEDDNHHMESLTRYLLTGFQNEQHREACQNKIHFRLNIAAATVRDYHKIRKVITNNINSYNSLSGANILNGPKPLELIEANELLHWLLDNNFIFVSMLSFAKEGKKNILNRGVVKSLGFEDANENESLINQASKFYENESGKEAVFSLSLSQIKAPMKREGFMGKIMLKEFDKNGEKEGVTVLLGMFTIKSHTLQRSNLPYLKTRLQKIIDQDEVRPQSSSYNARVKVFNKIMIEYLFECDDYQLRRLIDNRLEQDSRNETLVHIDVNSERKTAYALIAIPHEAYSEDLLDSIKSILISELGTSNIQVEIEAVKGNIIPLAIYFSGCSNLEKAQIAVLENSVSDLCTPWHVRFRTKLMSSKIELPAKLYAKYVEAFPSSYKDLVSLDEIIEDILHLEELQKNASIQFDILPGTGKNAANETKLSIYRTESGGLLLSEILPILHNIGFKVLNGLPTQITLSNQTVLFIDTFRLLVDPSSGEQNYVSNKRELINGLEAIFGGKVPSDSMNRLMLRPGLAWEDVDVLRSYMRYSIQIGPFFDSSIVDRVLFRHAELTKTLVAHFHNKFDPQIEAAIDGSELEDKKGGVRNLKVSETRKAFLKGMEKIQDATEDRVFQILFNLIESTIRTNAYRSDRPFHYLSFKFDCTKLEHCPEPRPLFEIFVYHAEMEGCHLRSGRVARGGIRWSDRLDDYRTEIFGLMRAQNSKNVLIIPTGAKGGFVVRGTPKKGQDRKAYGDEMYKILIRGLLDLTDNQLAGKKIRPPGVVCHDVFDPYLVVAADKGTAHLSDTANGLSAEYGFWLGDAFASGGSVGYDHKVEGITAKGAWVCAKHQFGKININPEKDNITVVGIGDMSGDVFGNGMLRSKTLKLVAAFNHAHIFLDPNPDCEASFNERQRMFSLPRSSWTDYNPEKISKGGGVFSRAEKAVVLTPEIQILLGTNETQLGTEELIKMILKHNVDLLYNGGLGTYIKSSEEDHREVNDKTNDSVRVDAIDVLAKVVCEGGNLGVTQKGRIEFALKGGLIDTDAIDNSGGVDCSDREVNLKILFGPIITSGKMITDERNKVLKKATSEVLDNILEDNYRHALCLSLDEIRSKKDPYLFLWSSDFLAEEGIMVAEREDLPTLAQIHKRGLKKGFTRPELSKLMAFTKMYLKSKLLSLDVSRFPLKEEFLKNYFPKQIYGNFREEMDSHLLLKELFATVWVGHIINDAGASLFTDLMTDSERSAVDVAFAYTAAEQWMNALELKQRIMACDQVPLEARLKNIVTLEYKIKVSASWILHFFPGEILYEKIGNGQNFKVRAAEYRKVFDGMYKFFTIDKSNANLVKLNQDIKRIEEQGFTVELAKEIALSVHWPKVFPIAFVAEKLAKPIEDTIKTYLLCGQATGMQEILAKISVQSSLDKWEAQALKSLFTSLRRTNLLLTEMAMKIGVDETLKREPALNAMGAEISRLHANPLEPVPISSLVVMAEKLHKAVARL